MPADAYVADVQRDLCTGILQIRVCGVGPDAPSGSIAQSIRPTVIVENGRTVLDCSVPLLFDT